MCGIFGYVGPQNAVKISIEGLKKLEYRGYDSAGIAGVKENNIVYCKEVGKVAALEKKVEELDLDFTVAIAHTRWATHGKPTQDNAHPHFDEEETLAVVHNGIIENHVSLRKRLQAEGRKFRSETDTEVIAHLVASYYDGDILKAVQHAMPELKGALAIALVHKDYPGQIIVAARESPLAIGVGNGEVFVSSDTNAFLVHTREVVYLSNSEVAVITSNTIEVYDETSSQVMKEKQLLSGKGEDVSKNGYEHYMLKEIYEQPQTIRNALLARFTEEYGTALLDGVTFGIDELLSVERIVILACGTSWHAGCVAAYLIEDMARIPVQVEISSEFRYKNSIIRDNTLVMALSQSGETADTLAAMREAKSKGAKVLGVCNVQGSKVARDADCCMLLRAGAEIGVASTKAFTSQLTVLSLFALMMARMRNMSKDDGQKFLKDLERLPDIVENVLSQSDIIKSIAKKYAHFDNFFFIGRRYMYPTAMEGALKLKEISYINANAYPAGEMKHGPIALIDERCPTVAFCANKLTYDKLLSNLMEIKARMGPIIAIAEDGAEGLDDITDDVIRVPRIIDELASIPSTIVSQLLAYYIALERGAEIDQPRNLAKSVTVE